MRNIERCRTAALGGHVDACDRCGLAVPSYNSCRNRHCSKCQSLSQKKWIEERKARILPTHYFHVVFTLPAELRPLARENPREIYHLLFDAAARTLLDLGRDERRLGAELGITAVLHTWTRELHFHPHIHCVVTGGGLASDGRRWIASRTDFLFPVKVMSRLFRGKLLAAIDHAYRHGHLALRRRCAPFSDPEVFARLRDDLYRREWVVYCKEPFGGAKHVYEYLGRYTHRVAISNQRLLSVSDDHVRFATKNGGTATLTPSEFIRRFLQHVLPVHFVKIRHYGLLASSNVNSKLATARRLLEAQAPKHLIPPPEPADSDLIDETRPRPGARCPRCKVGTIVRHFLQPGDDVAALLAAIAFDTS